MNSGAVLNQISTETHPLESPGAIAELCRKISGWGREGGRCYVKGQFERKGRWGEYERDGVLIQYTYSNAFRH